MTKAIRAKQNDGRKRRRKRAQLERQGVSSAKIEEIIEHMRLEQINQRGNYQPPPTKSNTTRNRKQEDRKTRKRIASQLERDGVSETEVTEYIGQLRLYHEMIRAGHPYPPAEPVRPTPPPAAPVLDEEAIDAFYEQRRIDDSKHKPAHVDSVLTGVGRATGVSAKVVKRRKTVTRTQYREMEE